MWAYVLFAVIVEQKSALGHSFVISAAGPQLPFLLLLNETFDFEGYDAYITFIFSIPIVQQSLNNE